MDDLASCVNRGFSWQYEIEARSILGTGLKLEVVVFENLVIVLRNQNVELMLAFFRPLKFGKTVQKTAKGLEKVIIVKKNLPNNT